MGNDQYSDVLKLIEYGKTAIEIAKETLIENKRLIEIEKRFKMLQNECAFLERRLSLIFKENYLSYVPEFKKACEEVS